jgi:hypothetical protein
MRKTAFFCTLLFALILLSAATSPAQVRITVAFGPPPLPVYEQPICPGDGYIWAPGYWAWDDEDGDYYWVPGTWILAPEIGFLWTPPWWGWEDDVFLFHEGYWGPHVGFYGGVVYGFGYFGFGFVGGRWENDHFFYNRSVTNINVVNVRNVYNETVVNNNVTINRVSYNGGPGGIAARPRPEDQIAQRERHIPPVAVQTQHIQTARSNPQLRASANQGKPPIAATPRPAEFHGGGVVQAREAGGPYHPPANRAVSQPRNNNNSRAVHPNELPKFERPAPPNTGDPNRDRKYQQQQEKMFAKQEQERQKLQQKQDQEHQRMERQNASQAQRQQIEERHQQQTQQLQQRHVQEQQRVQERQGPGKPK